MQSEQTPRQPQASEPQELDRTPLRRIVKLGAGECGDAIWECAAEEQEPQQAHAGEAKADEPRRDFDGFFAPETTIRGRLIEL